MPDDIIPESHEERIANLEKQVRNFRIVTAGDGDVFGGFGKLAKGDTLEERLSNLESAVANFQLGGDRVDVSGSFNQGHVAI